MLGAADPANRYAGQGLGDLRSNHVLGADAGTIKYHRAGGTNKDFNPFNSPSKEGVWAGRNEQKEATHASPLLTIKMETLSYRKT